MDEEDIRVSDRLGLIGLGLVLTGLLQSWNAALACLIQPDRVMGSVG